MDKGIIYTRWMNGFKYTYTYLIKGDSESEPIYWLLILKKFMENNNMKKVYIMGIRSPAREYLL